MSALTQDLGAGHTQFAGDAPPSPARSLYTAPTQLLDGAPWVVRDEPAVAGDTAPGRLAGRPAARAGTPGKIGRYHVLERLGAGGMGVVFAAFDPDLDRRVALKLLHPEHEGHDSQVRLLREAQALARLSHPNVVQIHDAGAVGQQVFLAMEFVRGQDLRRWLAAETRPTAEVLRVFLDAGRGLAAAHAEGLIHRDFKPENVLLGADGRVRVADFGLARAGRDADPAARLTSPTAAPPSNRGPLDVSLTATGAVLGTPAYMSPEQHLGQVVDARSDQFSFCAALWEALHRQHPFRAVTYAQTSHAVLSGKISEPGGDAGVPRRITTALRRGLAVDPAARWPDMHALLAALERDPSRARRRWLGLAALSTVVGAGGFVVADWRASEAAVCTGAAAELAPVWNDERRTGVAAVLAADDDPDLAAPTLARLDAYALAWQSAHRDACLDHRRGEQSTPVFDGRMRCLERRRDALAAAVELVRSRGASVDAAQLFARLPALSPCSEPERALSEVVVPDDPALADAVEAVDRRLLAARAQHHAGDIAGALAAAGAAVDEARRLDFRPLLADALATFGQIRMATDLASEDPIAPLAEAAVHALATRRDDLAADALARHFFLVAHEGHIADAFAAAPIARAVAERDGSPAALALFENNFGAVHAVAGDRDRAREHYLRAVELIATAADADPIERGNYSINLALVTTDATARRAAFTAAIDAFTALLGAHHPMTLHRRRLAAFAESDPATGATQFAALCPDLASLPPECGACFYALGHIHAALGELDAAGAALRRVASCPANSDDPRMVDRLTLQRGKAAAFAALLAGDPVAALGHADAALPLTEPFADRPWFAVEIAELQLARGRALIALGRRDEARTALMAARTTLDATNFTGLDALLPLWRADVAAHLAELDARP